MTTAVLLGAQLGALDLSRAGTYAQFNPIWLLLFDMQRAFRAEVQLEAGRRWFPHETQDIARSTVGMAYLIHPRWNVRAQFRRDQSKLDQAIKIRKEWTLGILSYF